MSVKKKIDRVAVARHDIGPTHRVRKDELGESFPSDSIEAVIVFLALIGIGGGAFMLYYLAQGV